MHPFFDAVSYRFDRPEGRDAYRVLCAAVRLPAEIDLIYKECGVDLPPLNLASRPDLIWKDVLEAVTPAGRLKRLCEAILGRSNLLTAHAAIAVLQDSKDPIDDDLVLEELVFVNRAKLRNELRKLADRVPVIRVLLVRGAAKSGKSWTKHLILAHADAWGEDCVYVSDGLVSTVDDVLEQLFTAIDPTEKVPERLETEDAWFKKACVRLQAAAKKANKKMWIVADDLGSGPDGPRLDPMIRRFFDQMALFTGNPAFAQWFRIVLIDYPDGPVPTKWKGFWVEERPSEADVQAGDVSQFLLRWARQRSKQLAAADADKLAAEILQSVDAPAAAPDPTVPRLQRLHDALSRTLKALDTP